MKNTKLRAFFKNLFFAKSCLFLNGISSLCLAQTALHGLPRVESANATNEKKPISGIEPKVNRDIEINAGPLLLLQDPDLKACTTEAGPHIASSWNLELFDLQLDTIYKDLAEKVKDNPNLSDSEFRKLLDQALLSGEKAKSMLISESSSATASIITTESERLLAEFTLKLALAQITDPEHSKSLFAQATSHLHQSIDKLHKISDDDRATNFPSALGMFTQTQLNFLQARHLRPNLGKLSEEESFNESSKIFTANRSRAVRPSELSDLDLLEIEYLLSGAKRDIGAMRSRIGSKEALRLKSLIQKLPDSEARLVSSREPEEFVKNLEDRSKILTIVAPFYMQTSHDTAKGFEKLKSELKNPNPGDQLRAERALKFIARDQMGTHVGYQTQLLAAEHSKANSKFDNSDIVAAQLDLRNSYNTSLKESIGQEFIEQFKIPNYSELESSQGGLLRNFRDFSNRITQYAQLEMKIRNEKRKPTDEEKKQIEFLASDIDIAWAFMQCHRIAQYPKHKKPMELKSPFGIMSMDFAACYEKNDIDAASIAHDLVSKKNTSGYRKDVAWIFGNFAFDVGTVIASGGLALIAKKAFTMTATRAIGAAALRNGMTQATTKTLMNSTKIAVGAVATDASVQVVMGTRGFVQSGIQNDDWHFENFKQNVAYLSTDAWSLNGIGKNLARITAVGLAGGAVNKLWRRGSEISSIKNSSFIKNNFGSSWTKEYFTEVIKGTVSVQVRNLAKVAAEAPFDSQGASDLKNQVDKVITIDGWIETLESSISGKLQGSLGKQMSGGFASRLIGVKGGIMGNMGKIQQLSTCFQNIGSSSPATK